MHLALSAFKTKKCYLTFQHVPTLPLRWRRAVQCRCCYSSFSRLGGEQTQFQCCSLVSRHNVAFLHLIAAFFISVCQKMRLGVKPILAWHFAW